MKPQLRNITLIALFLLASIVPGIAAYAVSGMDVQPPGNVPAGTSMTVSFVLEFPQKSSNVTFPQDSQLQMSTNLMNARWAPVMVLDGMTTKMDAISGSPATISGWYLSYPSYQNLQLRMILTGTIPDNPSATMDLVKIEEVDAEHHIPSTARVAMPEAPILGQTIPQAGKTPVVAATTAAATTKKPVVKKTFTPIPTDTPTQQSPLDAGAGLVAATGAALVAMRRK